MKYDLLLLGDHTPDKLLELASQVESYGFEHLWYADEKFYRDPYCSLTFISQHTSKLKLGTCVTDPFSRHPAITAMTMATLDECANGRGILGIGAGFTGLEEMGIKRNRVVAAIREAVKIIRNLWTGSAFSLNGETVSFHNGELSFRARSDIPILLASSSPNMLQLAGEIGDLQMLGALASKSVIELAKAHINDGAQRVGRNLSHLKLIARVNLILCDDVNAARDLMRPLIVRDLWRTYPHWNHYLNYSPAWEQNFQPLTKFIESNRDIPRNINDFALFKKFTSLVSNEMVRDRALAGNVNDIIEQIIEISETGIEEITLFPLPLPGQDAESVLAAFYKEVMPQVESRLKRLSTG